MDRRECDTHISTHARVRIVVVDFAIKNISREESLFVLFAYKNLLFSEDNKR